MKNEKKMCLQLVLETLNSLNIQNVSKYGEDQ